MFAHLNARTRGVVCDLVSGEAATIGERQIDDFDPDESLVLWAIATNLITLRELNGSTLATELVDNFQNTELPEIERISTDDSLTPTTPLPWTIGAIRACSFRGLAPAGITWEHDFNSESYLLHGPNGCGKSSLLGSISWCLTEKIFRDESGPSSPSNVDTFTAGEKPRKATVRSDALTLLDEGGESVPATTDYWVELQLSAEDSSGAAHELWIRRHSSEGLSTSLDGASWKDITSIAEAGISELDAELHIIMPARVTHLRFGENPDLVRLFSQIIGLDDLEAIAAVAESASRTLNTNATKIERDSLATEARSITNAIREIEDAATDHVESLIGYESIAAPVRTLEGVASFGNNINNELSRWRDQLLQDLGLAVPPEGDPRYAELKGQMEDLSGRVQAALEQLQTPLEKQFPTSVGAVFPEQATIDERVQQLDVFEELVRRQVHDRLEWAVEEESVAKAKLMLVASRHFQEKADECPVCTQVLKPVPAIRRQLEQLKPLADQPHLEKDINDFERELITQLNEIVAEQQRGEAKTSLPSRLLADWTDVKNNRFGGLLAPIASRLDEAFVSLSQDVPDQTPSAMEPLAGDYAKRFPDAFGGLSQALKESRTYLQLATVFQQQSSKIRPAISELLLSPCEASHPSLVGVLKRGSNANRQLRSLESVRKSLKQLYLAQKKHDELASQIRLYRQIAESSAATKSLGQFVRTETMCAIQQVEPQMKYYFEKLYNSEILVFDMLTPGHAANPEVKNQINVYLLSGAERIPMGPFSNAGRARALILAFVFAMLDRSEGTLGVLLFDDPALSLDDEHKARFIDKLVQPRLVTKQVIVATHYENFFKVAAPVFGDGHCLKLPPRRTAQDNVAFEPGDLLMRLEKALSLPTSAWRDQGANLRIWAERALRTISGYCPDPFFKFNKLQETIDLYGRIKDPRIATNERDRIVSELNSAVVRRVIHRVAHDEDPVESDVRDALTVLKNCQKDNVTHEIERLRELYNHASMGRGIAARPSVELLTFADCLPDKRLEIKGAAAAATGGVGISWLEDDSILLREHPAVRIVADVLAPVALHGQVVLLDPEGTPPEESDLVVVETRDGQRLVRRYWVHDDIPYLESVNPNSPSRPAFVTDGECRMRRIVGVLYCQPSTRSAANAIGEWTQVGNVSRRLLAGLFGVRVSGTSMEPIARDGQIVLVQQEDASTTLANGELACVDAEETEAMIKRCRPGDQEWVLTAINSTVIEDPIVLDSQNIRHVYRLAGVLFEPRVQ